MLDIALELWKVKIDQALKWVRQCMLRCSKNSQNSTSASKRTLYMAIQFVWLFVCSISLILRRFLVVLSTYSATNCSSFYKINHVPCEIVSIRCEASSMAARFILIAFTTQWSFSMVCHSNSCCDSNRDQASITFIWIQLLSEIVRKKSIDQWESKRERESARAKNAA